MKTKLYELSQVSMKDEYCRNAFEKEVDYLLSFDEDRLLAGFRETAGLEQRGKKRYGGWESMLIGGHTLGHYLTAAAQACANAQIEREEKEALFRKLRYLVDELLVCQENSKGKPGFLFGAIILDPANVELQFDYVEQNKTNIITEAWVPWYTMHKILDGLVHVYQLTDYENAGKVACGIGDWTYNRAVSWDAATHQTVLSIEYGGMNDALYELYRCTGVEKYLKAAHYFDEEALFEQVLTGKENVLTNRHANTTIPKFLGALNRYVVTGEERFLAYVESFWDMVVERHTYITGGNSEWEHFGEDYVLDRERTNCNNETCNTYNMLKMSRVLFAETGKKKYADYYENTLVNAILSSQNPHTGMSMYFQPMATGYFKVYGTGFDKFWCCTGSGMENFTKLNDSIYTYFDGGIVTNLYLSSVVTDTRLGIRLQQMSDFPNRDSALITIDTLEHGEKSAVLKFRIPDWSFGETVQLNGEVISCEKEEGYIVLNRSWKSGDRISITFTMRIIPRSLPDCDFVYGFQYGPVVLSADLGTENEISTTTGVDVTIPSNKLAVNEQLTIEDVDISVKEFMEHADSYFEKQEGTDILTFALKGVDQNLIFTPHYLKTNERYGIYWYFISKKDGLDQNEADRQERAKWREEHLLDTVQPGYGQYENDQFHNMQESLSVGATGDGTSRYAKKGGYFSYRMKVLKDHNHILEVHVSTKDQGKPLKILAGNSVVLDTVLDYNTLNRECFVSETEYIIEVPVLAELVEKEMISLGQEHAVELTIKGSDNSDSARLMNFMYMLWE